MLFCAWRWERRCNKSASAPPMTLQIRKCRRTTTFNDAAGSAVFCWVFRALSRVATTAREPEKCCEEDSRDTGSARSRTPHDRHSIVQFQDSTKASAPRRRRKSRHQTTSVRLAGNPHRTPRVVWPRLLNRNRASRCFGACAFEVQRLPIEGGMHLVIAAAPDPHTLGAVRSRIRAPSRCAWCCLSRSDHLLRSRIAPNSPIAANNAS